MSFWQFFRMGCDGCALLVQPLKSDHSKWKILLVLSSYEYLERLEGKTRDGIFFMLKYSKITSVSKKTLRQSTVEIHYCGFFETDVNWKVWGYALILVNIRILFLSHWFETQSFLCFQTRRKSNRSFFRVLNQWQNTNGQIEKLNFRFTFLKFIYSEKATKFCEISTLLLTGTGYLTLKCPKVNGSEG